MILFLVGSATVSIATEPPITAIEFDPTGQSVVVASQAGVRVLRWPNLARQRDISVAMPNIHDLAFSPDGKMIAVAGGFPAEEGIVEVLEFASGKSIQVLKPHEDLVLSAVWLDSKKLAFASLDHQITVCSLAEGSVNQRFDGHSRGVTSLCHIPSENILVSGSIDQNIRIWDLDSGQQVRSLNNHTRSVDQVALRPKTLSSLPLVASASQDRTVRFWQPTIGRLVRFARLEVKPLDLTWNIPGDRLLVSATDGRAYLIAPETAEVVSSRQATKEWAYCISAHPHDGSFLVAGRHGQLKRLEFDELSKTSSSKPKP